MPEGETVYEEAEEYHQAEYAQAVLAQGLDFVYPTEMDMDLPTALEYAFNTRTSPLPDC